MKDASARCGFLQGAEGERFMGGKDSPANANPDALLELDAQLASFSKVPRGDYVRPLSVIRAYQRFALARVFATHGAPDHDCVLRLLSAQRGPPSPGSARRLLRWWCVRPSPGGCHAIRTRYSFSPSVVALTKTRWDVSTLA